MSGFVYILQDQNNKLYIGSTNNLLRRLQQHRNGHTQTTRSMKNFKLVLSQKYNSLEMARRIERKIKKLKRKDYIEKMIRDGYIRLE